MKDFQKIIKYGALAFAIVLIVMIFRFAVGGLMFVGSFFSDTNQKAEALVEREINFDFNNYDNLDIKTTVSRLTIKTGDSFSVSTNNKDVTISEIKDTVVIRDNRKPNYYYYNRDSEVIVTLPTYRTLDSVIIDAGAGRVSIDELNCRKANINLGAGEVEVNKMNVTNEIKLSGGIGKLTIHDGRLNNLEADLGVGSFNATLSLTGRNKIDAGVGEVSLDLLDSHKNYTFNIDKGLGDIKLDRNSIQTGVYGDGIHTVEITGGVGEIKVKTMN